MPIYEYQCHSCNGRFQKLVRGYQDPDGLTCPRCASHHLKRLMSQVAQLHSDQAKAEMLGDDRMLAGLDENDPRSVAKWAKQLGQTIGEDAGADWNEMVDQMIEEELDDSSSSSSAASKSDDLGWG